VILEPKPSVPSTVFDSIMSFSDGHDDNDNDKVDENGYGYYSFFKPPMMMGGSGSGSSSSPADDMDMDSMMMMFNGNGNGNESSSSSSSSTRFSNAFKSQFGGGNMTAVDVGGGIANNQHSRWQPSFTSQDRREVE
jgi:hypothetical protein